jgi:hypothetical protein
MTHGYVSTAPPAGNIKLGYLHVETDDEYLTRVQTRYPWWSPPTYSDGRQIKRFSGKMLDAEVETLFSMQRKIVEVFP